MYNDELDIIDLLSGDVTEDYLEEANTADGFDSIVSNMFGHMLKFIHQRGKQTSSWVRTIDRNSKDIIKLYPKLRSKDRNIIINDIDSYLDKRFAEGLALLKRDTEIILKIPRYPDWNWDFIFNRYRIKEFLLKNVNTSIQIDDIRGTIYDYFKDC